MGRPGPVTVLEYEPFPDPSEETVTISARFQNENGMALREGEACLPRISAPAFPWTRLGKTGCPACPGKGPWTCLPAIGGTGNRMCFSLGAVIDASTNESGNILAQVLALSPLHKGYWSARPIWQSDSEGVPLWRWSRHHFANKGPDTDCAVLL